MRDIEAKEMRGHSILSLERFHSAYHWMIEFVIQATGEEMRLFLTDAEYNAAISAHKSHIIKIKRYAHVTEGHIIEFKPKKRRRRYR